MFQGRLLSKPDKTALITGASAGLGQEFAHQLAARGYSLVLVARREQRLKALASQLRDAHSVAVTPFVLDLTDPDGPATLCSELQRLGIDVDYLVNNAGAAGPDLLLDRDWLAHRAYIELMMTATAALTHLLVPGMVERGKGRVLNVASMAGRLMRANDTTYGPSKAWMIAHSEALANTLRGSGVRVLALCPGFVRTEFHADPALHELRDSIPSWLWYSAEVVVREGLAAIERGRVVYVSGRIYRWLDPLTQSVLTRWLLRGIERPRSQEPNQD